MVLCRAIDNEGEYEYVSVPGERVDAVVQEDVALMKIDVEGFEPLAFESSKGILDGHSYALSPPCMPPEAANIKRLHIGLAVWVPAQVVLSP